MDTCKMKDDAVRLVLEKQRIKITINYGQISILQQYEQQKDKASFLCE